MKTRVLTYLLATIFLLGCDKQKHSSVAKMCTLVTGIENAQGEIDSQEKIPFKVDQAYGYQVNTVGLKGKHLITEQFILPAPGVWGIEDDKSDIIEISSDKTKLTRSKIVNFDTTDRVVIIYSVAEGDPKGKYLFRIGVDDQPLGERAITIE